MSVVIDPHGAEQEVQRPVVAWEGQETKGTETWQGKLTTKASVPQVELRPNEGKGIVVRVNMGNVATLGKGKKVAAGIVLSGNRSFAFGWDEFFTMSAAIEEAIDRLTAEQEKLLGNLAVKFSGAQSASEP